MNDEDSKLFRKVHNAVTVYVFLKKTEKWNSCSRWNGLCKFRVKQRF